MQSPPSRARRARWLAPALLALACIASPTLAATDASKPPKLAPLRTGFADPWVLSGETVTARPYADVRAAGASFVRLYVRWGQIAPTRPGGDTTDPDDPGYHWDALDKQVDATLAAGLTPILDVLSEPGWAHIPVKDSTQMTPAPRALEGFARAIATRYSGHGHPRVRYWQVWNEPNISGYLIPQWVKDVPVSPVIYRNLVVSFAKGVKAIEPSNLVVVGGLTPFKYSFGLAPLDFMRQLFCLKDDLTKRCSAPVPVDVWAVHPYTWGDARHKAPAKDDVSLGNLPELRRTLTAAVKAGNVTSKGAPQIWTTEFCWASTPPVDGAVPMSTLTRWVPEALHQMWLNGITNVIWFQLYDRLKTQTYHCGLYATPGADGVATAKAARAGFRFPFVAYAATRGTTVWGRTPTSRPGAVVIETRGSGWRRVATLKADANGMFAATLSLPVWAQARARFGGETSPAFAATAPPVPTIVNLF